MSRIKEEIRKMKKQDKAAMLDLWHWANLLGNGEELTILQTKEGDFGSCWVVSGYGCEAIGDTLLEAISWFRAEGSEGTARRISISGEAPPQH